MTERAVDRRERAGEAGAEIEVSVLVLVSERPGDLVELYQEHAAALRDEGRTFEFVFALERWRRERAEALKKLAEEGEPIRVVEAPQGAGEAALLHMAARESAADVILTLPGYPRVEPTGLPKLTGAVEAGADLAAARRHPRRDSPINRLQTRTFHFLLRLMTGVELRDVGSGVRAIRRKVLSEVPLYGDFLRFLPVFATREGYRVEEVDVAQHPAERETRLYRPGVYLRRLVDLFGVLFLTRFTYKPLRFFGLIGSGLAAAGGSILAVLFVQRIGGQGIADPPMLQLGVLLATQGVQIFSLGLIGEIIVHFGVPGRKRYRLTDEDPDGTERTT